MNKIKYSLLIILSLLLITSCNKNNNSKNETEKSTDKTTNTTETIAPTDATEIEDPNKEGFEEGNIAPDFEVKLLTGETVKLSDYRGKVVLLNFWATWCSPCRREMPDFQKLHDELGEDFVLLAVDKGESEENVQKFITENEYTFPVGVDSEDEIKYPIQAFPTTFLIDKEGRIDLFQVSIQDYNFYKPKLEKLLNDTNKTEEENPTDNTEPTELEKQ